MTNSILKIALSSGDLLDTSIEGISQLRRMGYYIENNKLDMRTIKSMDISDIMMDDISLLIRRSGTSIKIIAHSHGKSGDKDKRENRYYFLYNNDDSSTLSLLDILKDFTNKAIDESKKNNFDIVKNNKESIYLFDNLEKVIEKNTLSLRDEDLLGAIRSYLSKGRQPQFETSNIEMAISFFISLDKELSINNIYYILYIPKRSKTLRDNNIINIYVDQERHIPNIEPIKEFKEYLQNYKKLKVELDIKNKIKDTQKDIEIGILNSYSVWKDKRKDLIPEVRKGIAENLYPIVSKFANDTIDEINLYSISQSDRIKYNIGIGNVAIKVDRWFMRLIKLLLIIILAFAIGAYLSPYVPIIGHNENIYNIGNFAEYVQK